jgi:hypothetical protein
LNGQPFEALLVAKLLLKVCASGQCNTYRPHSSLGMRTPAEFAKWWQTNQIQLT